MVREDNPKTGLTTLWTYDNAGNILSEKVYVYTTGTPSELLETNTYTYGNANWGDLLTKYNGQTISYDNIGNPTSYYNGTRWAMTWEHGRQLATMSDTSTSTVWTNTYNSAGLRTSRTDGTTTYTYYYEGGRLSAIKRNDLNMWIIYDENGPVTLKYGSGTFHYVTNLQGDVVAIVGNQGQTLVEYTYDAWGKVLSITGDYAYNLGIHNPILYRGYVYDHETGLYYCQSRYYDPETGRFINADAFTSTGQGILGNNMFAYCGNNPVNYADPMGTWTITISWGPSGTAFIGASESESITIDEEGVSYQSSYSDPAKRETTTVGLLSAGYAIYLQVTNKQHASELEGVSTYLGGSVKNVSFDVVIDKPVADHTGELVGIQFSYGIVSEGVDLHVAQTYTETIKRWSWEEVWRNIGDFFGF